MTNLLWGFDYIQFKVDAGFLFFYIFNIFSGITCNIVISRFEMIFLNIKNDNYSVVHITALRQILTVF